MAASPMLARSPLSAFSGLQARKRFVRLRKQQNVKKLPKSKHARRALVDFFSSLYTFLYANVTANAELGGQWRHRKLRREAILAGLTRSMTAQLLSLPLSRKSVSRGL